MADVVLSSIEVQNGEVHVIDWVLLPGVRSECR